MKNSGFTFIYDTTEKNNKTARDRTELTEAVIYKSSKQINASPSHIRTSSYRDILQPAFLQIFFASGNTTHIPRLH